MCTEILGRSRVYPRVVEKLALVPNALNGGKGYPARIWLSSWDCTIHTYMKFNLQWRCSFIL